MSRRAGLLAILAPESMERHRHIDKQRLIMYILFEREFQRQTEEPLRRILQHNVGAKDLVSVEQRGRVFKERWLLAIDV